MVWQTDSSIVVMLTGRSSQSRSGGGGATNVAFDLPSPQQPAGGQQNGVAPPDRHAAYWPLVGPMRYGSIIVETMNSIHMAQYAIHELKISDTMVSRRWRVERPMQSTIECPRAHDRNLAACRQTILELFGTFNTLAGRIAAMRPSMLKI